MYEARVSQNTSYNKLSLACRFICNIVSYINTSVMLYTAVRTAFMIFCPINDFIHSGLNRFHEHPAEQVYTLAFFQAMKSVKKKPAGCAAAPMKKPAAASKPASWLRLKPDGCSKCRWVPGCTRSCWAARGKVPK